MLLVTAMFGCDKHADKAEATAAIPTAAPSTPAVRSIAQNPAASFKAFVSRYTVALAKEQSDAASWKVSYDVRKTDSLVTPFVGLLTLQEEDVGDAEPDGKHNLLFTKYDVSFAAQEEKWVYKSLKIDHRFYPDQNIRTAEQAHGKVFVIEQPMIDILRNAKEEMFQKAYDATSQK